MRIADTILPEFTHEMKTTRRLLERLPEEKASWKPHEKSTSLGSLGTHIAHLPWWVSTAMATQELNLKDLPPRPFTTTEAMLSAFDGNVAEAKATLEAAENEAFDVPWTLRRGEHPLFTMPRVAVLRMFAVNHLIHHRGQLSVYLRLLDVPLPSVYGPSADEPV